MLSEDAIRKVLRGVKDPELDMNIIDIGLVYDVAIDDGDVHIKMTLTSPGMSGRPRKSSETRRLPCKRSTAVTTSMSRSSGNPIGRPSEWILG